MHLVFAPYSLIATPNILATNLESFLAPSVSNTPYACHNGMFENYSLFTREGRLGNSWHTQIPRGTPGPTHHASIQTTERYLGVRQDLHDAPCDRLGLDVRAP